MGRFMMCACFALSLAAAGADTIVFGMRPMPPYVMKDEAGRLSGIEYEIVERALAARGHSLDVRLYPLARVISSITAREIEGAATILPAHTTGAYLSDAYVTFHNVALGLKESRLSIGNIRDLKGHSIVAFQLASKALGPDFAEAVRGNPGYVEQANQSTQVLLLFSRRVELVVGDRRILRYYIRNPGTNVATSLPVDEFPAFPPTEYRVAFLSERHARDFNAGLAELRKNGMYDSILQRYAK